MHARASALSSGPLQTGQLERAYLIGSDASTSPTHRPADIFFNDRLVLEMYSAPKEIRWEHVSDI